MKREGLLKALAVPVFLLALLWVIRYWHSAHFGLYEDDLTIIPGAIQMSFSEMIRFVFAYIVSFSGQARPLHHSFVYLFSWLGWHIGGLWGPYWIGYLLTAINICLFYFLLKRAYNPTIALVGGLAYVLYSADTTQAYLTMSLGFQPSMTFLLCACHAYCSNKRIPAYLLAFLIFFSYETPALVFLAAPLLKKDWNTRLLKEFLVHGAIMAGMIVLVYFLRVRVVGTVGVLNLTPGQMIVPVLDHILQGPIVSLGTYLYRPIQMLASFNLETAAVVALAFAAFLWIFSRLPTTLNLKIHDLWQAAGHPGQGSAETDELKQLGRLAGTGLVMLAMAYPLTFTVRAYALSGRDTRVHTAGVMGAAILVASVFFLLIALANGHRVWHWIGNGIMALALALLVGYGFIIQRDYVMAWQYQRQFWTELLPLVQDAQSTTYILVTSEGLKDTAQIDANTWALSNVLGQLYEFPSPGVPRVFRLRAGWQDHLEKSAAIYLSGVTSYVAPDFFEKADFPNIILIDTSSGKMVRRTAPLTVEGQSFSIMQPGASGLSSYPRSLLYRLMIVQP
jgi:hypothetical protein